MGISSGRRDKRVSLVRKKDFLGKKGKEEDGILNGKRKIERVPR